MTPLFRNLFSYNFQINRSLDDRFKSYDYQLDLEIIRLANHLLNAHQIWLDRINGKSSLKSPWDDFPIETFAFRNQELHSLTMELPESKDLDEIISFKTFAGVRLEKKLSDILIHVVNHSTYHRGQLALLMRSHGLEPVPSDYIHWATI